MFVIDVENSSGTKQGPGPITTAVDVRTRVALDQVGEASFRVPASDPRTDLIGAGYYYHIYRWDAIKQTRQDLGTWKHRAQRTVQMGDEAWLEVECYGLEIELVNELVYFNRAYKNTATNTIVSALVALASGWSDGSISNPGSITVGYQGESIFQSIIALAQAWDYHLRQGSTARTLDFGQFGSNSSIRLIMPRAYRVALEDNDLIALITSVEVLAETDEVVNKIVPLGAGLGEQQLNINGATVTDPSYPVQTGTNADGSSYYYIYDTTSISTYGTVAIPLVCSDIRPLSNSDADITYAKNTLYQRALAVLEAKKDPLTVYGVTVTKLRGSLEVGDRVRLVYRGVVTRDGEAYKWVDVDALQYVLAIDAEYGADGGESYTLELSSTGRRPGDDGDIIAGIQHDLNVWKTHLQTYPCRSMDTRYEEMDSSHDVDIPIDIDDGVLYLNSALIRLKTRPLRATASGAKSGGGHTSSGSSETTTDDGGATTPTSEDGGGEALTSGGSAHRHVVFTSPGSDSTDTDKFFDVNASTSGTGDSWDITKAKLRVEEAASGTYQRVATYNDSPAHTHSVTTNDHNHDVSIPNHNHGMEHDHEVLDHTHDLNYGIHDDTEYPDTVRIEINGTDRTSALGGPWAVGGGAMNEELDITTYLVNAGGGLRQEHTVTISCDSGQGTVESVVKLQMTVQGIAVS